MLPLDARFKDDRGQVVDLRDYFDGEMPVILSLNYSDCPMLCQQQLNGLVAVLKELNSNAGQDYRVVSISIDPRETVARARQTKEKYFREYGRAGTGNGWNFLVGDIGQITRVAEATGFQYRYVPEQKEYAHAAVLMLCTPQGKISRYLYGIEYDPQTIRLSLVEASEGKIGSPMEQLLLFCFMYDETAGKYGPQAFRIMQLGGMTTVVCLLIGLVPYWLQKRKKSRAERSAPQVPEYKAGQFPSQAS